MQEASPLPYSLRKKTHEMDRQWVISLLLMVTVASTLDAVSPPVNDERVGLKGKWAKVTVALATTDLAFSQEATT